MAVTTSWIAQVIDAYYPETVRLRRHFHQHPELSFHEEETAEYIAAQLARIPGMVVKRGIGSPTSVIGELTGKTDDVCVGIRADIDALPIQEVSECAYHSLVPHVMHACGHDAHMAIALSVAHIVGELNQKHPIKGNVRFIFQPAEETTDNNGKTGGQYLAEAGAASGLDLLFALHVMPEHPTGTLLMPEGYCTANVDEFFSVIKGEGGHGAYPHLGTDPIWLLGTVLQSLQGIVSRKISPLEPAVLSVCSIEAGNNKTNNVIPSEVTFSGTLRSYSPLIREQLIQQLESVLATVRSLGGDYQLSVTHGESSVCNESQPLNLLKKAARQLIPDAQILPDRFGLGGEDFSHLAKQVPSAMFFLGCAKNDSIKRELHSSLFDIDEPSMKLGVLTMTGAILNAFDMV
ncbi:MAG: amidohydrolase [Sporolactobacillus sp.]